MRGLFNDTIGSKKWTEPGYLAKKLGKFIVPVVRNAIYGTLQNNRSLSHFGEAYEELLADDQSKIYLFFPVQVNFILL